MNWTQTVIYSYPLLIAICYLLLRYNFENAIQMVLICNLLICIPYFLIRFKNISLLFTFKSAWIRGFSFGLTQILLLEAQKRSSTGVAFNASVLGLVLVSLLSHFYLKEKITKYEIIGIALCVVGVIVGVNDLKLSFLACFAGISQGLTQLLTRRYFVKELNISHHAFIATTMLGSALVILVYLNSNSFDFSTNFSISNSLLFALFFYVIQLYNLYIFKILKAPNASVVANLRTPFAYLIEFAVYSRSFPVMSVFSMLIILLASFLNTMKQKTKSEAS